MALLSRRIPKIVWICGFIFGILLVYTALPKRSSSLPMLGQQARSHERRPVALKTVIVDEHHEVLPYWYEVAQKSRLSNFSLIHIDGHSDLAPPSYIKTLFRWPKNRNQITPFMQSNDVFVMGAMATGLVNSMVWVWPEWTRKSIAEEFGDYTIGIMDIGYFDFKDDHDGRVKRGCCVYAHEFLKDGKPATAFANGDGTSDGYLFATPDSDVYEKRDAVCHFVRKSVKLQIMSISHAMKHGIHPHVGSNEPKPHPTILDIDEDYWGCERGSDIVVNSGINWTHIEEINYHLTGALLPKTVDDETNLNMILESLIEKSNCDYSRDRCTLDASSMSTLEKTGCLRSDHKAALTRLMKIVKRMSNKQQQVIRTIGFCLETTPSTSHIAFGDPNVLTVCTGASEPGSDNSEYFTPDELKLKSDMKEVFKLLDDVDFKNDYDLKLITIARSFRDKYTPMALQHRIEEGILTNLKRTFHSPPVTYDKNNMKIYDL